MKPGDILLKRGYWPKMALDAKGVVYEPFSYRVRILMFDENEVFDSPLENDQSFEFAKTRTAIYSRASKAYFDENTSLISSVELSSKELAIHRPDLPLRLNCFDKVFWSKNAFTDIDNFVSFLATSGIEVDELQGLKIEKVVIFPTGQQTSDRKPVLLENSSGYFTGLELMFNCFRIQREYVNIDKPYFSRFRLIPDGREEKRLDGIGLYRQGIKGNVPSFYLGGSISMMELESDKSRIV